MKIQVYNEALKMWAKCQQMRLFNISFCDILEQMHKTAIFEERHRKAAIITELINEDKNQ